MTFIDDLWMFLITFLIFKIFYRTGKPEPMDRTTVSTVLYACWLYNVWYWIDRSVFTAYHAVRTGNVLSRVCLWGRGGGMWLLHTCSDLFHVEVYLLTSGLSTFDWKTLFYCKVKGSFLGTDFCLLLGWLSLSTCSTNQIPTICSWTTLSTEQETSEYLPANNNNNEFKKKNIFWRISVFFVRSLIPQFGTSGGVYPGGQSKGGFFTCVQLISQIHLCCDTCWPHDRHLSNRTFLSTYSL